MTKKNLIKSTVKKDKSNAEISVDALAALCESETKKAVEKAKKGKQACFGTAMYNPEHDSCKGCDEIKACGDAQEKPKSAPKVTADELDAMCKEDESSKPKKKKSKVSATALAASIESEMKGSDDSKTESKKSGDAKAPDKDEKADSAAESDPKDAESALPEPDIDVKAVTKGKGKTKAKKGRKSPKDCIGPKTKPNPKVKPMDEPATVEHILPYVKLLRHPDVDLGIVIQAVLDAKPETTGDMAQIVVKALAEQSPTAACNSAYGKTRNIRDTLLGYGDISIEGKQITWLK